MELTPAGVVCGLDILLAVSQSARPDSPDLSRSWRRDACLKAAVPRRMNQASALPYPTDSLWPPAANEKGRSEERRVGKSVSVRVNLGGRRIVKKKKKNK